MLPPSLDPSIKPSHGLEISTLLRKSLLRIRQVRSDCKPMLSVGVEVGLEGDVGGSEDGFGCRSLGGGA